MLEVVSRRGTVATFKLLIDHGALLGLRCLHTAVESAAFAARNNELEKEAQRMAMVRFLVEELQCNVNGMDVPEGLTPRNHFGTPLNYAAHTGGGEEVARYLLAVSLASPLCCHVGYNDSPGGVNDSGTIWCCSFEMVIADFPFLILERCRSKDKGQLPDRRCIYLCERER